MRIAPTRRRLGAALLASALAALPGCGEKKHPVTGKVLFKDGAPVTRGLVVLSPADPAMRVGARGYIQDDGSFTLSTEREGDGVLAGKFQVLVHGPNSGREDDPRPKPAQVHPKYLNFDTSGLAIEVKPGKNDVTLTVDRAPGAGKR